MTYHTGVSNKNKGIKLCTIWLLCKVVSLGKQTCTRTHSWEGESAAGVIMNTGLFCPGVTLLHVTSLWNLWKCLAYLWKYSKGNLVVLGYLQKALGELWQPLRYLGWLLAVLKFLGTDFENLHNETVICTGTTLELHCS